MMEVILTHKAFDRIPSDIASIPIFAGQFPLRQVAGLIDWRMNGRISNLIETKRLAGSVGDSLIMPTNGRLQSEAIFFYGLGHRTGWQSNHAEHNFLDWIGKLNGLNQESWLLTFGGMTENFLEWRQYLRVFIHAVAHQPQPACRQLYVADSAPWILETKKRNMDLGDRVRLQYDLSA